MSKVKNEREVGVMQMKMAAVVASAAAKEALIAKVEEEIPVTEEDEKNPHRQLGAIITAATGLYADMLHTVVACYEMDPALAQQQAKLAAGVLQDLVATPLLEVGQIADGTYVPSKED